MRSNPTFEVIQRLFQKNCRNFALRNMNRYRMKQFIKKITILFLILFSFTTYATSQYRETHRLLTEVQDYINEKPDSAIVVLKSYRGLASQDEGTEALYAMLITKAEYIATDSIASDSLIQGAVKYYNKESDNSEMILE